jgi:hypothetical protein
VVVAVDALGGKDVHLDQLIERHERCRAGAHVVGQRRERQLDSLALELLALPVERLMVGVFVDQNHRQQARPRSRAQSRGTAPARNPHPARDRDHRRRAMCTSALISAIVIDALT